jgi:RNA polymerase sigma factor (sigma-70 family)
MSDGQGATGVTTAQIERALGGDQAALRALVKAVTPPIQATVARVCGSSRSEVEDLVQDVLIHLLEDGGRRLRQWDPQRGVAYLRKVSWNCAVARLRNRSRYPRRGESLAPEQLDLFPGGGDDQEAELLRSRQRAAVLVGLELELSAHELQVFELLLEGVPAREICQRTGTPTENAVHLVRHRIVTKAQAITRRLAGGEGQLAQPRDLTDK